MQCIIAVDVTVEPFVVQIICLDLISMSLALVHLRNQPFLEASLSVGVPSYQVFREQILLLVLVLFDFLHLILHLFFRVFTLVYAFWSFRHLLFEMTEHVVAES